MRAVVETQWSVCIPVRITASIPFRRSRSSRSVPMKALFTCFWITGSEGSGRTIALMALPGRSARKGESGSSERCCTW